MIPINILNKGERDEGNKREPGQKNSGHEIRWCVHATVTKNVVEVEKRVQKKSGNDDDIGVEQEDERHILG